MNYLDETGFKERVYDIDKGGTFQGLIPAIVSFHTMGTYCENMRNILEDGSKLHTDINFFGVDVDAMNELVKKLAIRAIPTTLIIPIKGSPAIAAGLINTPDELENAIARVISKPSKLIKL